MEQSLSVKVKIVSLNETRRFRLENPTLSSLQLLLIKLLKVQDICQFNSMYSIKYIDTENDLITIESEEEFSEALFLSKSTLLKLEIHPKKMNNPPETEQPSCPWYSRPYHRRGKRWGQLHREALKLFESEQQSDLELARSLLLEQLSITPQHPITLYNLACIESRLKNISSALEYLEKSFQSGYRDFSHIQKDSDLDFIRNTEQYQQLISAYEKKAPSSSHCNFNSFKNRCHSRNGWWLLEKQIHFLFKSRSIKDLELARQLLLKQYEMKESAHTLYNLACVESLLKNETEALSYLKRAIDLGFDKFDHMDKDEDLDNLRHTDNYKLLREELRNNEKKDNEALLSILEQMGFTDREHNLRILNQVQANLETALSILFSEKI